MESETGLRRTARVTQKYPLGRRGTVLELSVGDLGDARIGQFLMVHTPGMVWRPFSLSDYDVQSGSAVIAFRRVGIGTEWLAERAVGDPVEFFGPLGQGFPVPDPGVSWAAVGFGPSMVLMMGLVRRLRESAPSVQGFVVAPDDTVMPMLQQGFAGMGVPLLAGDLEDFWRIPGGFPEVVMGVGPRPMLAALDAGCQSHGARCYVAVEERMACGVGACWACVIPGSEASGTNYFRVCRDGPVFDAGQVDLHFETL